MHLQNDHNVVVKNSAEGGFLPRECMAWKPHAVISSNVVSSWAAQRTQKLVPQNLKNSRFVKCGSGMPSPFALLPLSNSRE